MLKALDLRFSHDDITPLRRPVADARRARPRGADRRQRHRQEHAARVAGRRAFTRARDGRARAGDTDRPAAAGAAGTPARPSTGCSGRRSARSGGCTASWSASSAGSTIPRRSRATARRRSASPRSAAGRCRPSSTPRAPRSASRTSRSTRRSARLSGGEAARALLAGVLLARPDVLLLDEPTNHLDADGLEWLEGWLAGFDGAVLVVSHDRAFLDAVVTRVLELDGRQRSTAYAGGYTAYREEKARRREAAGARLRGPAEAPPAPRGRHPRHARLRDPHRAHRRRARLRQAEALREEGRAQGQVARAAAASRDGVRALDRQAARARGATYRARTAGVARRLVAALRGVDARVLARRRPRDPRPRPDRRHRPQRRRQEHAARAARGHARARRRRGRAARPRRPARPRSRTRCRSRRRRSPTCASAPARRESEARRLLGHFGLEGRAALRPLRTCSPGQRSRVAIVAMVAARAELLLLDEPTNHLDLPTLEALEAALREHPGAIVAAGHDRAFLAGIGVTRRLEVSGGRLTPAR